MAAQTYVYIMTCRKAVKVGISRNLPHRLQWFRASVERVQTEINRAIAGHRCYRSAGADGRDAYFNVIEMYRSAR